jgi:hypothetical protein
MGFGHEKPDVYRSMRGLCKHLPGHPESDSHSDFEELGDTLQDSNRTFPRQAISGNLSNFGWALFDGNRWLTTGSPESK